MAKSRPNHRPAPSPRPDLNSLAPADVAAAAETTIGDHIIAQVRQGVDPVTAAATAGVTPQELTAWAREGQLVSARLSAGADWRKDFTAYQQDCYDFAGRLLRAAAITVSRLSMVSEQIARGGRERTNKRTKTQGGVVVEEVVTVETLLPDAEMVKWRLEKLAPQVYGSRATLNITVTDLTDTDDVADNLRARMMEIAAGLRSEAIEATASDAE